MAGRVQRLLPRNRLEQHAPYGRGIGIWQFNCGLSWFLKKEYVSSAFHAMFRREVIERVGLYDERLARTEDNDYFYRVREAGYKIRFDVRIQSKQIARSSLKRMLKQKYGNGIGSAVRCMFSQSVSGLIILRRSHSFSESSCWRALVFARLGTFRCVCSSLCGGYGGAHVASCG